MPQKAKYIPWILGAILLVIVVVSVNELFKQQTANKILQEANNALTEQQNISEDIILSHNDSLDIYNILAKELSDKRLSRKDTIKRINEEHVNNKTTITSDNAVAHIRAVSDIFRTYNSN